MSVIKVNKTKDYTIMSNYHFKERNMSLKAKGLLSLMLSLPADWDYSIAGLVAICKENETAIKSTLDELKQFGYLEVINVEGGYKKACRGGVCRLQDSQCMRQSSLLYYHSGYYGSGRIGCAL